MKLQSKQILRFSEKKNQFPKLRWMDVSYIISENNWFVGGAIFWKELFKLFQQYSLILIKYLSKKISCIFIHLHLFKNIIDNMRNSYHRWIFFCSFLLIPLLITFVVVLWMCLFLCECMNWQLIRRAVVVCDEQLWRASDSQTLQSNMEECWSIRQ